MTDNVPRWVAWVAILVPFMVSLGSVMVATGRMEERVDHLEKQRIDLTKAVIQMQIDIKRMDREIGALTK